MATVVPSEDRRETVCNHGQATGQRFPANLSVTIEFLGQGYHASLRDISQNGAMIEAAAPLMEEDVVAFACGAMRKAATVVWKDGDRVGLQFADRLCEQEIVASLEDSSRSSRWMRMALPRF